MAPTPGPGQAIIAMKAPASSLVHMPKEITFPDGAANSCETGTAYDALRRLDISARHIACVDVVLYLLPVVIQDRWPTASDAFAAWGNVSPHHSTPELVLTENQRLPQRDIVDSAALALNLCQSLAHDLARAIDLASTAAPPLG
jgi:hypothetical protein